MQPPSTWNPDKASVWTIGMISLYAVLGSYHYTPSDDMRKFVRDAGMTVKKDTHPEWWWVALIVAYRNGHDIPTSIFDDELLKEAEPQSLNFWKKTLCIEKDRATVKNLKDILSDIS